MTPPAGVPLPDFVSSGGVVGGKTPDLYLGGNAGDFRRGRLRGSAVPQTPDGAGQRIGFGSRRRPDGEYGYLKTVV